MNISKEVMVAPYRNDLRRLIHYAILFSVVIFIIVNLLVSGCVNIRVRMGQRPPSVDSLEQTLRVGQSTPKDVVSVLGEPFGQGRSMLPIDPKPRTMWTYYYSEGDLQDARASFLFVYFDQDRYDGYMWFSSLPR